MIKPLHGLEDCASPLSISGGGRTTPMTIGSGLTTSNGGDKNAFIFIYLYIKHNNYGNWVWMQLYFLWFLSNKVQAYVFIKSSVIFQKRTSVKAVIAVSTIAERLGSLIREEVEGDDGGSETPYHRPVLTGSRLHRQFHPSGATLLTIIGLAQCSRMPPLLFDIKSTIWGSC